jgi:hypothetical protein
VTEEELEKAIERHARRRKVFMEEGLSEGEAWDLAEQMFIRDQDGDDRRLCFECNKYIDKKCIAYRDKFDKPTQQLRFILQRCAKFKLKGTT